MTLGFAACRSEWAMASVEADEAEISLSVAEGALGNGGPLTDEISAEVSRSRRHRDRMVHARRLWAFRAVRAGIPDTDPSAETMRADALACAREAIDRRDEHEEGIVLPEPEEAIQVLSVLEGGSVLHQESGPRGFGWALERLHEGRRVARAGWNGRGMWIRLVQTGHYDVGVGTVGRDCAGLEPWIGLRDAQGRFVPWTVSQADALAKDWTLVD